MSKCEQCIYYPKCDEYPFDESGCKDFKDRNNFVELPCKVDDEVFINITGKTFPFMVISIILHNETPTFKAQHGINLVWVFGPYDVGKTVFLTSEEAEAALVERKRNDQQ